MGPRKAPSQNFMHGPKDKNREDNYLPDAPAEGRNPGEVMECGCENEVDVFKWMLELISRDKDKRAEYGCIFESPPIVAPALKQ